MLFGAVLFQVNSLQSFMRGFFGGKKGSFSDLWGRVLSEGVGVFAQGSLKASSLEKPIYTSAIVITLQSQDNMRRAKFVSRLISRAIRIANQWCFPLIRLLLVLVNRPVIGY